VEEEQLMKRALIAVGTLAVLALLVPSLHAQSRGGARGKVFDEEGAPVADATVSIQYMDGTRPPFEVQTSDKGEYIQIGLPAGGYQITANKEGYVEAGLTMRIGMGGMTPIPDLEIINVEAAAKQAGPNNELLQEKFAEGVALARAGSFDEAEVMFKEVLELQPGIPEVYRNLAYVYEKREDWENADMSLLSALDLRPGDASFVASLAELYRKTGREDEAMALLTEQASDNPEDAVAQFNRGLFLLDGGQSADALAAFEAALAADPELGEAHYHLGTILVGLGKVPESVAHLETYLATNPDNAEYAATAQGLIEALKQ
jgi:Flp pilus assembly protein TadD